MGTQAGYRSASHRKGGPLRYDFAFGAKGGWKNKSNGCMGLDTSARGNFGRSLPCGRSAHGCRGPILTSESRMVTCRPRCRLWWRGLELCWRIRNHSSSPQSWEGHGRYTRQSWSEHRGTGRRRVNSSFQDHSARAFSGLEGPPPPRCRCQRTARRRPNAVDVCSMASSHARCCGVGGQLVEVRGGRNRGRQ